MLKLKQITLTTLLLFISFFSYTQITADEAYRIATLDNKYKSVKDILNNIEVRSSKGYFYTECCGSYDNRIYAPWEDKTFGLSQEQIEILEGLGYKVELLSKQKRRKFWGYSLHKISWKLNTY